MQTTLIIILLQIMKHVIIIDSVCYLAGLTLKVRRPFVLKKYEATIDAMYNES